MVGWPVTTPSASDFLQLLHRIFLVQIAERRRDGERARAHLVDRMAFHAISPRDDNAALRVTFCALRIRG